MEEIVNTIHVYMGCQSYTIGYGATGPRNARKGYNMIHRREHERERDIC